MGAGRLNLSVLVTAGAVMVVLSDGSVVGD
jgi:hypothetical protein